VRRAGMFHCRRNTCRARFDAILQWHHVVGGIERLWRRAHRLPAKPDSYSFAVPALDRHMM